MKKQKRVELKIDSVHTAKLVLGDRVTIKVPEGATQITLQIDRDIINLIRSMQRTAVKSSLAEIFDVFFNGRAARA